MKKLALLFVFVQSLVFANDPVITLNGDSVVELYLNSYYDDPGATAFDSEDGDLSDSIEVTGTYDSSTIGSYVLAYSVTDSDGNESVKIRTINVVDSSIRNFEVTTTYIFSNQGAIGAGDTVIIYVTIENTGNANISPYHSGYTIYNFNGNQRTLTICGWHGDNYDISVGFSLTHESTYQVTQSDLDSGGIDFTVNVRTYDLEKTSRLSIPFSESSDEIILNGQISANNNQIKKVADPTDNLDAVNKRYVDQRTLEQTIPGQNIGDLLYWNGQGWQKLSAPQEQSTLRFCEGELTWGPCKVELFLEERQAGSDSADVEVLVVSNGSFISEIGLYVSTTNQMPNENDITHYENEFLDFDKSFTFSASPNTTYFVRAYAINNESLEKSYSKVITITTASVDQNGNTIYSKTYGNQEWSTQSANVTTYRDGTPIPEVTDPGEWANLTTGAWCYYDNDSTKGRLYNWYAVAGIHDNDPNTPNKEFAPEGWHVPSPSEWHTLREHLIANGYNYYGTTTVNKIAKSMASTTGWISDDTLGVPGNNQSLNNNSGFNAFPKGRRIIQGSWFSFEGEAAFFWSSTASNTNAYYRSLYYNISSLGGTSLDKRCGLSVRFVKD
jgi:uncharacterized protein (TIGR02145 family)